MVESRFLSGAGNLLFDRQWGRVRCVYRERRAKRVHEGSVELVLDFFLCWTEIEHYYWTDWVCFRLTDAAEGLLTCE